MTSIAKWQAHVHQTAVEKGWWEDIDAHDPNIIASKLALVHSEVSEALEAVRDGHLSMYRDEGGKPEGMVVELADAVIRIFDLCGALDLDLAEAIITKSDYNQLRSHRHGGRAI